MNVAEQGISAGKLSCDCSELNAAQSKRSLKYPVKEEMHDLLLKNKETVRLIYMLMATKRVSDSTRSGT